MKSALESIISNFEGEIYTDEVIRKLYATDASVYRIMPEAVAIPKSKQDLKKLINFATLHGTSLIPRAAGTSLNGQAVGKGIVVDISKYWNKILEVNVEEKWVKVEPGVNLDELNKHLANYNLFFGPETSTSNRCKIGGMIGNNSCGSHSIIYGTTRDNLLEVEAILSDESEVIFKPVTKDEFDKKSKENTFEAKLYQTVYTLLSDRTTREEIIQQFPKPEIRRRNTGYALDELIDNEIFSDSPYLTFKNNTNAEERKFNFCKLLAGSEGTLAFITAAKLKCVATPPAVKGAMVVHLNSVYDACLATIIAKKYNPGAIELLDNFIIENARKNIDQQKNLFFIKENPKAVIVVEWARADMAEINALADALEQALKLANLGYYFPRLYGADISSCWSLRKAGLGLLANVPGDAKAVACIEDTAVDINDQPEYISEFEKILEKYNKSSVYYAHIGDGEIHLRPILDLKVASEREIFVKITQDVATLVKKYRGSLSGEHGDGIVRGYFLKQMIGEKNYELCKKIKLLFDPNNIFNPGKITDVQAIDQNLRYEPSQITKELKTFFDFSSTNGLLRMAEKCNGAGDCLKSHHIGGTMCPSFMATRNEKDSTRARANILREVITQSKKTNCFDSDEIKQVMDLCLSCKGCKNECNSNVDVAMMKAEFLQHYHDARGIPFSTFMIGHFVKNMQIASIMPEIYNTIMQNRIIANVANKIMGIHPKRSFPLLYSTTLRKWYKKHYTPKQNGLSKTVYLFCDEFSNYNDVEIGIKTIHLLNKLGYEVIMPDHYESGRTFLSKGMIRNAQKLANQNISLLKNIISNESPLIGIEPSAILTFRDEYPLLCSEDLKKSAFELSKNCLLVDEFLSKEIDKGNIDTKLFKKKSLKIKLHGHCHQKALSSVTPSKKILEYVGHHVEVIPSGCCGMAGSFGYEHDHYDISMQIGELVLFPAIRKAPAYEIAAPGTSCRHQILDGTGRTAKHPVEIIWESLS